VKPKLWLYFVHSGHNVFFISAKAYLETDGIERNIALAAQPLPTSLRYECFVMYLCIVSCAVLLVVLYVTHSESQLCPSPFYYSVT